MQIKSLELYTRQLRVMLDFYANILELPVLEQSQNQFTVQAGQSDLTFVQKDDSTLYPCHYAFNIPEASLAASKQWLQARVLLLIDAEGRDEFYSENWNAHLIYYTDPDGNIGEFTARHDFIKSNEPRSTSHPVISLAEIGITVDDVPKFVADVESETGLLPYRQQVDPNFTAVGDENGSLIVVKTGRTWFPTNRIAAQPVRLRVSFTVQSTNISSQHFKIVGIPYKLTPIES